MRPRRCEQVLAHLSGEVKKAHPRHLLWLWTCGPLRRPMRRPLLSATDVVRRRRDEMVVRPDPTDTLRPCGHHQTRLITCRGRCHRTSSCVKASTSSSCAPCGNAAH